MSRSPPPPNPSIVNASNLLPSVNVLFDEVLQRERANSQSSPGSRSQSAWSGFPGPERNVIGRGNPGVPHAPLPPLQVGRRPPPQPANRPHSSHRPPTEPRHLNIDSQHQVPVHVPAAIPVIPNRMGGRYAQTPCHSNGQPHAPGLMPQSGVNQASPVRHRQPRPSTSGARHGHNTRSSVPINTETSAQAGMRIFQELMQAAGNPECFHCIHDVKIESRRQVAGSHGAVFSQYAHGTKPQHATSLPAVEGLINIPFTPKPISNQTLHGVSLTEILDFRDVLEDPRERVLDNSLNKIYLTIEVGFALSFTTLLIFDSILDTLLWLNKYRETVRIDLSRVSTSHSAWLKRITLTSRQTSSTPQQSPQLPSLSALSRRFVSSIYTRRTGRTSGPISPMYFEHLSFA
ncbi:hypothetical protein B0H11DRAFT_1950902 [Mycena galericulata]|nr:hypothetical protein B0H11DRAFT_1950902 [Mycena galericulata]